MNNNLTYTNYFRSILGILLFITLFTLLIPFISILVIISLGKLTNWILEKVAPLLARFILWVLNIKYRIQYHQSKLEDSTFLTASINTPAIYIVNHASTLDILTILALGIQNVRFIAKWEMQYFPFFFMLGRLTGQIFIKRGNREKAVQTLQKNYEKVQRYRRSILIAPEGTRKHEMPIGPFKKGAFRMALDLGYPIVPIYFEGTTKLCKGGSLFTKSGNITAHVFSPISTDQWKEATLEENIEDIRNKYIQWSTGI
tara:strand:+ start:13145 stop:13915 length:771 start_codon:yes stop_codon:yes gene_type:complete